MKLSIAAPWYKSAESVLPFYNRCLEAWKQMPAFDDLEIVCVEDGGNDGTWPALCELARKDERVKAVRLSRNFGQHHALTACLDLCGGDWIVVMDCDLQDRPEEIPALWAQAQKGYDMVCARRVKRKDKVWKKLSSRWFTRLFNFITDMDYDSEIANFRIMSAKVANAYRSMREASRNMVTQLQWLGFKTSSVPVAHDKRFAGGSSYTLGKLVNLAIDSILSYSDKPLRLLCFLGLSMTLCGLLGALYIVLRKIFYGIPISGWSSLIISIWISSGIIIGVLGIVALYIGRIYNESKQRPLYVISERINI